MIEQWFDPKTAVQQGTTVVVLIAILYYYRQDVKKQRDEDRADRAQEQQQNIAERANMSAAFHASITELKGTVSEMVGAHRANIETIVKKAEETERLSEARFDVLLRQTLAKKGEPLS